MIKLMESETDIGDKIHILMKLLQIDLMQFFGNFTQLKYCIILPITVAKVWTVFARSNAGIVGLNPSQGMDVCVRLLCLCCSVCR
jgi:hypothetical protein